jgi:hypothetical protein
MKLIKMNVAECFAASNAELAALLIPCRDMALNSRSYLDRRLAAIDEALSRLEAICAYRLDLELAQDRLEATVLACSTRLQDVQDRLSNPKPLTQEAGVQCNLSLACRRASKRQCCASI